MILRKKYSYQELIEENRRDIMRDEQSLEEIDRKVEEKHKETRQRNQSY